MKARIIVFIVAFVASGTLQAGWSTGAEVTSVRTFNGLVFGNLVGVTLPCGSATFVMDLTETSVPEAYSILLTAQSSSRLVSVITPNPGQTASCYGSNITWTDGALLGGPAPAADEAAADQGADEFAVDPDAEAAKYRQSQGR